MHPVAFWIAAGIVATLAITPLIFVLLDKAGKLKPALRTDLWTRYKSWLVLAPLMEPDAGKGRLSVRHLWRRCSQVRLAVGSARNAGVRVIQPLGDRGGCILEHS